MSESNEEIYGHQPTSEVVQETPLHNKSEFSFLRSAQGLPLRETNEDSADTRFNHMLRNLSCGLQKQMPITLVKFDPDDLDADIEGWCSINEIIVKHKDLKGIELLILLTRALHGRAANCLLKLKPDNITWESVKQLLLAKFSKPMLMQDYFDRILKFQINNTETAADAAMRLWQLVETIPQVDIPDEVITGFVISVLSRADYNVRRELNTQNIKSKSQLCHLLRCVSIKRRSDDIDHIDNKRPRFNDSRLYNITCRSCGQPGHKSFNCPRIRGESSQMQTQNIIKSEEKRPLTCFTCGNTGHVSTICPNKRGNYGGTKKEVKLCDKKMVTGELHVAGMICHFLFDSGSECSLIKKSITQQLDGIRYHEPIILVGIGNSNIRCTEQILCVVSVQHLLLEILFHIIDDQYLTETVLLGRDILDKGVDITVGHSGVMIFKSKFNQMCEKLQLFSNSEIQTDLAGNDKELLVNLLIQYKDSFVEGFPVKRVTTGTMKIDLINPNKIVQRRPYRLSASERDIVNGKISELLDAGIIRESNSPFASPILLVKKKDGSDRLVVDYRELNSNTRCDKFPIPLISDQINRLSGSNFFTSLDMTSGFHSILIESESIERTAFVTPDGQFEYVAMPFGLKNAPSVYQRCIQRALKMCDFAQVYIDDVLIPSTSVEQGLKRLELVLKNLTQAGFSLNMKKCSFIKKQVTYLGYVIKSGEIRPNPKKVQALANISKPSTATQVRQFIGLASYFRQFIPNFSILLAPLYPLMHHKGEIKWTQVHDDIHVQVIKILTSEPVLCIYDPNKEIELHTDASSLGYGAILIQRQNKLPHVVEYFSRRTTDAESRYHSYELETLAVVRAVEHFRHYLYGRHFTVRTDCNALKSSSTKRDLTPRVHRWWAILQSYDFKIEYREGRLMSHADFLSRNPLACPNSYSSVKEICVLELQRGWLIVEQQRDKDISDIIAKWQAGDLPNDVAQSYDVRKGLLYRKIQRYRRNLWLPIVPLSLVWSLISHVHVEVKHLGYEKTLEKLYESYWFPGMNKAVKKFVDACIICKTCKGSSGAQQRRLHPIPKVSEPWHTLHIDISGKLSGKSQRKEYTYVLVDAFTKYVLLRYTTNLDANSAVDTIKYAVQLFGTPKRVIVDQGRCFISKEFKDFCSYYNIELHIIATGAARANGQVERIMHTLKNLLTVVENSSDSTWRDELGDIQLVLNTTRCRVTGYTPMELMFGISTQPLGISKIISDHVTSSNRGDLEHIRQTALDNIQIIGQKDAERLNKGKARVKPFCEGDFVFLKSCERHQVKLDTKFKGPFKIVKVLENDRYELRHVDGSNRTYKYPHESLRRVPEGRAGLTEVVEAIMDDVCVDVETVSAIDSSCEQSLNAVEAIDASSVPAVEIENVETSATI